MELSVELLHLLVPAAEEVDLLEQHEAEQLRLLEEAHLREASRREPPLEADRPAEEPDAPPVPTHAQAVAIVQRYLGGEVLEG